MGISLTVCPHTRKLESHAHVVWACHLVLLQVVVQSLLLEDAVNKGFDLASKEEGQGSVTKDFKALFQQTRSGLWVQFPVRQTTLHHYLAGRVKNITTSCLLLMSQFSHNVAVLPNTWLRFTALFWAVASSPILSLLIQNCYFCLLMYGAPLCLQMHCFTAIIFHCMLRNACWRWSADS